MGEKSMQIDRKVGRRCVNSFSLCAAIYTDVRYCIWGFSPLDRQRNVVKNVSILNIKYCTCSYTQHLGFWSEVLSQFFVSVIQILTVVFARQMRAIFDVKTRSKNGLKNVGFVYNAALMNQLFKYDLSVVSFPASFCTALSLKTPAWGWLFT